MPPRAATVMSYEPIVSPAGMITPGIALSLEAAPAVSIKVPSFTEVTVLLPTPPKKPVPFTLTVTGARLEPVETLRLLTAGAEVVTAN